MKNFRIQLGYILAASLLVSCSGEEPAEQAPASNNSATTLEPETHKRKAEKPKDDNRFAAGTFSGRNNHTVTGEVSIIRTPSGFSLILTKDFSVDDTSTPSIGFGNGSYVASTNIGTLRQTTGRQSFTLPSNLDPSLYGEVYIWCDDYSIALGVAEITLIDPEDPLDDTYGS